jgi:hypothetical protein
MRQVRTFSFLAALALAALTLVVTSGAAATYPAGSPEARLDAARAELIALRGSLETAEARLWLSRAVASLGWAIGADCWSADGAALDPARADRCLDAIRVSVRRLWMTGELHASDQITEVAESVRDLALASLNAASAPPALRWKVEHDIYVEGDGAFRAPDARLAVAAYIRAWKRLNADAFTPARVTAGAEIVQPKLDFNPAGSAEAFQITATGDVLSRINVFVDPASTASSLVAGVYADGEGGPGQLLAQGSAPLAQGGGDWNTVHVPRTAITPGATYWIAILTPSGGGTLMFRDRCCRGKGTTLSVMSQSTSLTQLPATWSSGRQFKDGPLSAFGAD